MIVSFPSLAIYTSLLTFNHKTTNAFVINKNVNNIPSPSIPKTFLGNIIDSPNTKKSIITNTKIRLDVSLSSSVDDDLESKIDDDIEEVDVAIIGSGIGGLTAGAILNTLYNKTVTVLESHYLPGGCAHAFTRFDKKTNTQYTFDSGPTILLGCSSIEYQNPLQQVLNAINQDVEWIQYYGWGMMELLPDDNTNDKSKGTMNKKEWKLELGADGKFENGALLKYSRNATKALKEFNELCTITKPLLAGLTIPALSMRSDNWNIVPLLFKYTKSFFDIIKQGELVLGTFAPFIDGPIYQITDVWLRDYIDALAFSLSGLSANRTSAAAMAFVLYDCHRRNDAVLDYPKGGLGNVIDALARGLTHGNNNSTLKLNSHVNHIDFSNDDSKKIRATGVTLRNGKKIKVRDGVICNAPIWSLESLLGNNTNVKDIMGYTTTSSSLLKEPNLSWDTNVSESKTVLKMNYRNIDKNNTFLETINGAEMTGSFMHLHIVLNITGLDISALQPHYTVMSRSLSGDNNYNSDVDGPCGPLNMIALSNPCIIDPTLSPNKDCIILHAYGAANEPYELWEGMNRTSNEYKLLKQQRSKVLYKSIESIIPDYKERVVYEIIGSPLTHERYLRRPRGTYGAATEDYLMNGKTPVDNLFLCGDGIFPGIGIPAVALSGCSAANSMVGIIDHWNCLNKLEKDGRLL